MAAGMAEKSAEARLRLAHVACVLAVAVVGVIGCGGASVTDETVEVSTTTGALVMTITGLPATAQGNVTVLGTGFSTPVPVTIVLNTLNPGNDTLVADSVMVPGVFTGIAGLTPTEQAPITYRPTLVGSRLVDSAGVTTVPIIADSVTAATVNYAAPAAPVVSVSVSNAVAMNGQHLQVTWTSSGASACWGDGDGAWAQAPSIATNGTLSIAATGGANQLSYFSVTCVGPGGGSLADQTVLEQSNSTPGTGDLTVFTYGLPGGVSPASSIAVVGQTTPASGVWTGLAPGAYTITAANITANGVTYTPTPANQIVHVSADSESAPLVTYSAPGVAALRPARPPR